MPQRLTPAALYRYEQRVLRYLMRGPAFFVDVLRCHRQIGLGGMQKVFRSLAAGRVIRQYPDGRWGITDWRHDGTIRCWPEAFAEYSRLEDQLRVDTDRQTPDAVQGSGGDGLETDHPE